MSHIMAAFAPVDGYAAAGLTKGRHEIILAGTICRCQHNGHYRCQHFIDRELSTQAAVFAFVFVIATVNVVVIVLAQLQV